MIPVFLTVFQFVCRLTGSVITGSLDGKYMLYGVYKKPVGAEWPAKLDSKWLRPIHRMNNKLCILEARRKK